METGTCCLVEAAAVVLLEFVAVLLSAFDALPTFFLGGAMRLRSAIAGRNARDGKRVQIRGITKVAGTNLSVYEKKAQRFSSLHRTVVAATCLSIFPEPKPIELQSRQS